MSAQKEQVRVRAYGIGKSLIQHRPKTAVRFVWLGVTYERRRRRDAIGLPIFEPAAVQP
ncbi:hypothetical protein QE418_003362 [Microbacterium testaceum]|uniref:hypothetical protein n=1 Tax=Microbacterium TaxID=33882 RepID=UPI00277ED55C|nr:MULTISPECIES: hypothetical protein [Microbacterium]MDQ1113914.1 hypothetical protein [Microbacterium testaceum]MDR6098979.1 hypothetical protein [Microbacterium sp. SORGH_AS_0454]